MVRLCKGGKQKHTPMLSNGTYTLYVLSLWQCWGQYLIDSGIWCNVVAWEDLKWRWWWCCWWDTVSSFRPLSLGIHFVSGDISFVYVWLASFSLKARRASTNLLNLLRPNGCRLTKVYSHQNIPYIDLMNLKKWYSCPSLGDLFVS